MDRSPDNLIAFQRMFLDEAACAAWLAFRSASSRPVNLTMSPPAHSSAIPRSYLWAVQVLLKDFGPHAEELSRRVKEASQALAGRTGCSVGSVAA